MGSATMMGENEKRWRQLCELAAGEQDHDKLIELIQEINRLLEEKEKRLKRRRDPSSGQ